MIVCGWSLDETCFKSLVSTLCLTFRKSYSEAPELDAIINRRPKVTAMDTSRKLFTYALHFSAILLMHIEYTCIGREIVSVKMKMIHY